jgi:proteasome assembly chaperone 4
MSQSCPPHAISVQTKYLPASDPSLPALALQVTRLVDSYMLWVGTTERSLEDVSIAPSEGSLARDWACAMPPNTVCLL